MSTFHSTKDIKSLKFLPFDLAVTQIELTEPRQGHGQGKGGGRSGQAGIQIFNMPIHPNP